MIGLVDFLKASGVGVSTESLKVHLACWSGREHPIDVFLAEEFDAWQSWHRQKNFDCKQVVSLIDCGGGSWLFAGVYSIEGRSDCQKPTKHFIYMMKLLEGQDDLVGRIFIAHLRGRVRNSYIWYNAEKHLLPLIELRREKLTVGDFPGYKHVLISHARLRIITKQNLPSWRSALSHVRGIYLITDTKTGKPYVGKADGNSGLWQRWCDYAKNGHGGNKELMKLLDKEGPEHAVNFQFSILEIMEPQASEREVLAREEHWMSVLHSRIHGLNGKPDRAEEEAEGE